MKILYRKPRLWFIVRLFYPQAKWGKVAFTFGDTIYASKQLSADLEAHEKVHCKQHHFSKLYACWVFIRYRFDREYRLFMEIPAFQAQWDVWKNSSQAIHVKNSLANSLCGPLYGNLISYEEAFALFK